MIEIRNLTKRYDDLVAVDDLSLDVGAGELFGFIGPNGAGKSTTMKVLACLLKPDSGSARVAGYDTASDGELIRRTLGYMPDFLGVYDDLTVEEYLRFFAGAFAVPRARRGVVIDAVLELTNLVEKKRTLVSGLSRGMSQRLGVARVLIHEPKVLLLDEPASGLDPRARIEIKNLLVRLRDMGKCLMVSSHILSELGEMSTSIGIIERGKLVYAGTLAEALERASEGERLLVKLESSDAHTDHAAFDAPEEPATAGASPGADPKNAPDPADAVSRTEPDARVNAEHSAESKNGATAPVAAAPRSRAPQTTADAKRGAEALSRDPRVSRAEAWGHEIRVELAPGETSHHVIFECLLSLGLRIRAVEPQGVRLEDAFLKLTKGAVQ